MFNKGTLYVQFLPVNGAEEGGPMFGPAVEVSVDTETGSMRCGKHVFVFSEKCWHKYSERIGLISLGCEYVRWRVLNLKPADSDED